VGEQYGNNDAKHDTRITAIAIALFDKLALTTDKAYEYKLDGKIIDRLSKKEKMNEPYEVKK
jgi:hypothetical protein